MADRAEREREWREKWRAREKGAQWERGCRDGEKVTESREAGREGMERTRKREGREGRTRGRGVSEVLWKTKMGAGKRERREEKNEREIVGKERG